MLAVEWQAFIFEVATISGATVSVAAITMGLWRFTPLKRWWQWIDQHREDDRRDRLVKQIKDAVEPRFAAIEAQLHPNGGSSIADKLNRVEIKVEAGVRAAEANTESLESLHASYLEHVGADLEFQRSATTTMDQIISRLAPEEPK